MRCECCDNRLTDQEACSKDKLTGEHLDLCRRCREWSFGNIVGIEGVSDEVDQDITQFFGENMHLTRQP